MILEQKKITKEILIYLSANQRALAKQIATAISQPLQTTQSILIDMDDMGLVFMKNGFYSISQAERNRTLKSVYG